MTNNPYQHHNSGTAKGKNMVSRVFGELLRMRPKDLLHPLVDPRTSQGTNLGANQGIPQPDEDAATPQPHQHNPWVPQADTSGSAVDRVLCCPISSEKPASESPVSSVPNGHGQDQQETEQSFDTSQVEPPTEPQQAPAPAPDISPERAPASDTSRALVPAPTVVGLPPLVAGEAGADVDPIIVDKKFGSGRHVPDTILDGWRSEKFTMRSASLRGRMHRYNGAPRQDSVQTLLSEDGNTLFVAVADGVSAAQHSHRGSDIAARYAVQWLEKKYREDLSQEDWLSLAQGASYSIQNFANKKEIDPMDFATTLVCAAVTTCDDHLRGHVLSIGDSGFWAVHADGPELLEGGKEDSDALISSSAVNPLPVVPEDLYAMPFESDAGETVLLGTDGIGDPLGGGGGPLSELLVERLYQRVPTVMEFGHIVDFSKVGFDDDRTLVAIWPSNIGHPEN